MTLDLSPITLSSSQLSLWDEQCKRKWGFKYIDRIETAQTPKQKLGDEVEKEQLQPYLLQGRPFEYTDANGKKRESAEIAASALAYLPQPLTPGLEMQRHFLMPSPTWITGDDGAKVHSGVAYQGYLDLWHEDSRKFPGFEPFEIGGAGSGMRTHIPCVGDFKTTGDLKWAKTKDALLVDPQAMLYSMHALYTTRAPAVDLGWIYMQTNGTRKSKRTSLRVFPDHVAEQFQRLDAIGQELASVRRAANRGEIKTLDLEPNPDMCSQFGGCPYQSRCNLSPAQIMDAQEAKANRLTKNVKAEIDSAMKGIDTMTMGNGAGISMLDQLRAKKAAAEQAGPSPTLTNGQVAPVLSAAPSLLPSPAAPVAAASQIVGVFEDGTNVYTHDVAKCDLLGNAADGRAVYRRKPAPAPSPIPVHAPIALSPVAPAQVKPPMVPVLPSDVPQSIMSHQPINPPESALPPAPPTGDAATPKRKPGRPPKAGAVNAPEYPIAAPSLAEAIVFVKAIKAACEAFLTVAVDPES